MKCTQFRNNLVTYVEGSLPACVKTDMNEHRTSCPPCRRLASVFADHWQDLEIPPRLSPVPGFTSRVMQRLAEQEARSASARRLEPVFRAVRPVMLIAILFAGMILGYHLGNYGQTSPAESLPADTYATYLELTFGSSPQNPLAGQASGSVAAAWLEMVATRMEADRP